MPFKIPKNLVSDLNLFFKIFWTIFRVSRLFLNFLQKFPEKLFSFKDSQCSRFSFKYRNIITLYYLPTQNLESSHFWCWRRKRIEWWREKGKI